MNDNDVPGYLGAAVYLAQEQQRQAIADADAAEARNRDLARQASDLDHELQRQTQQANDVEDDYWALFNLLKQPMSVIAQRNRFFAETYQESRKELALVRVRELAYKELAIQLGSKIGMSPEAVQRKADAMRADVLRNQFPAAHGTNATESPVLQEMGDKLLHEWTTQRQEFLNEYSRLFKNATYYDLIGREPENWAHVLNVLGDLSTKGNTEAQLGLGHCHFYAKGTPQNTAEAERWWLLSHKAGQTGATLRLHYLYRWTGSDRFSEQKAEEYLKLAEQANPSGCKTAREEWEAQKKQKRWAAEEVSLLEKLSTITPGERAAELDSIKGRGYAWEQAVSALHQCQYRVIAADTVNKGSFFSPNRLVRCLLEITNPTDYRKKLWASLDWDHEKYGQRPREAEGTSQWLEKNGTTKAGLGQYPQGTTSDYLILTLEDSAFKSAPRDGKPGNAAGSDTLTFRIRLKKPFKA